MENASKALIMAGGILIALLVIGALMLMFNNLSSYQNANEQNIKDEQIVKFNQEFIGYERDNVTGIELISLSNKILSNNMQTENKNYNSISIEINNISKLGFQYIFKGKRQLTINGTENELSSETSWVRHIYDTYGATKVKQLISNLDKADYEKKTIKEILGKKVSGTDEIILGNREEIIKLREYSEFKSKTFTGKITGYAQDGRINKIKFEAN